MLLRVIDIETTGMDPAEGAEIIELGWQDVVRNRSGEWVLCEDDYGGGLYRFDGWVRLGAARSGAVDPRSGRAGRPRVVWGWHPDPAERSARRQPERLAA